MLGIDPNTWLAYEGVGNYGHGLWPTPLISPATLISQDSDWGNIPATSNLDSVKLIFREDSFDPVTRVRRGRIYEWQDAMLKQTWHFPPHPAEPTDRTGMSIDGLVHRTLHTYRPVWNVLPDAANLERYLIVLGNVRSPTVWRFVSMEACVSGEHVVTLHARSSLGVLPELQPDRIPEPGRSDIVAALDRVAEAAFKASAVSLIDLCRAAVTVVLANWLRSTGETAADILHLDVGGLLKLVEKRQSEEKGRSGVALMSAIELVRLFHSRGKPNEQKRYNVRAPSDGDAQLVLQALGFLLREIGWAK